MYISIDKKKIPKGDDFIHLLTPLKNYSINENYFSFHTNTTHKVQSIKLDLFDGTTKVYEITLRK